MRAHSVLLLCCCLLVLPSAAQSELPAEGGIGISTAPDTIRAGWHYPCASSSPGQCPSTWDDATGGAYDFENYSLWLWDFQDVDIDLLLEERFDGVRFGDVTETEISNFLYYLDEQVQNRLGWQDYSDLALVFDHFHKGQPYDPQGVFSHFKLFEECENEPSVGVEQINHVDIYLLPQCRLRRQPRPPPRRRSSCPEPSPGSAPYPRSSLRTR